MGGKENGWFDKLLRPTFTLLARQSISPSVCPGGQTLSRKILFYLFLFLQTLFRSKFVNPWSRNKACPSFSLMLYNGLSVLPDFFLACFLVLMSTFCTANIRITCPSFSVFFLENLARSAESLNNDIKLCCHLSVRSLCIQNIEDCESNKE